MLSPDLPFSCELPIQTTIGGCGTVQGFRQATLQQPWDEPSRPYAGVGPGV